MTDPLPRPLLSTVDSERFGMRIGRAALPGSGTLPSILAASEREALRMLIVRCRSDDFASIHALEAVGARLMDTIVYYSRSLRDLPAHLKPTVIRPIEERDFAAIPAVAHLAFQGFPGHYHADPALDQEKCDQGYAEWATALCTRRDGSKAVFVAEHPAAPLAGFVSVRLNSPTEGEIEICGVHPSAQRQGIYWSFLIRVMEWCRDQGADTILTSTQITHLTSRKTWARQGFEPAESYYTFHLWFDRT